MPDFIPRRDAALLPWSKNLSDNVSEDFAELGVPALLAQELADLTTQYADAYRLANDAGTAGPSKTLLKNKARERLENAARAVARIIRAAPTTTAVTLNLLGIDPAPRAGALSHAPAEPPDLIIDSVTGRVVRITLTERETNLRRRPAGVLGATIFRHHGPSAPETLAGWTWHCNTGLTRLAIKFPHLPPGTQVWLTACWFNTRFEPGPLSNPPHTHLGFGILPEHGLVPRRKAA